VHGGPQCIFSVIRASQVRLAVDIICSPVAAPSILGSELRAAQIGALYIILYVIHPFHV